MTFYLAWGGITDTFQADIHGRNEVDVFNVRISHGEGEFPLAVIYTPIGAVEASIKTFSDTTPVKRSVCF